jgi:hypothetical protein
MLLSESACLKPVLSIEFLRLEKCAPMEYLNQQISVILRALCRFITRDLSLTVFSSGSTEKCFESRNLYIEASECFGTKYWFRKPLAPPIFSGLNYQRCGPKFNNSRCSTNKEDWEIQEPANGPCCSPTGYCIPTSWDCTCENCVDFGELTRCRYFNFIHYST